jgi:putative phage-type endonuclease
MNTMSQEFRRSFVGGSDAAAILGLSPWATEVDVYLKKSGIDTAELEGDHLKMGHALEPVVAKLYAEHHGLKLIEPEFKRHPVYEHIGAHADRITADGSRIVEIKTTNWRNSDAWGVEGTDDIPVYYLCQVVVYMEVYDIDRADVAVMISGDYPKFYTVLRNKQFGEELCRRLNQWYIDHVLGDTAPKPKSGADALKLVDCYYPRHKLDLKKLDLKEAERITGRMKSLEELDQQAKHIKDQMDAIKADIKEVIGEAEGVEFFGKKITWKNNKDSVKIDWQAVASEIGAPAEIVKKHTSTTKGARVLRLPKEEK